MFVIVPGAAISSVSSFPSFPSLFLSLLLPLFPSFLEEKNKNKNKNSRNIYLKVRDSREAGIEIVTNCLFFFFLPLFRGVFFFCEGVLGKKKRLSNQECKKKKEASKKTKIKRDLFLAKTLFSFLAFQFKAFLVGKIG